MNGPEAVPGGGDRAVVARHREVWAAVNDAVTDGDADTRWSQRDITWGLFAHPEADLGVLGDVAGLDVLEVGCGTAYLGAWLARTGARVVGLDVSHHQLRTAQRCQVDHDLIFPLLEASGEHLPLADGSFDVVVSEYGVAPWCDPGRWVPEAARVLRPGGRLVFLTSGVLAALCVPAEGGVAGDRLLRATTELTPVRWPGGGVEHHPGHGAWIALLRQAGFMVDALHELRPPPDATDHGAYEIVTAEWARRWPAEDLWVARRVDERSEATASNSSGAKAANRRRGS